MLIRAVWGKGVCLLVPTQCSASRNQPHSLSVAGAAGCGCPGNPEENTTHAADLVLSSNDEMLLWPGSEERIRLWEFPAESKSAS